MYAYVQYINNSIYTQSILLMSVASVATRCGCSTEFSLQEAASRASENFWKISALQPSWNFQPPGRQHSELKWCEMTGEILIETIHWTILWKGEWMKARGPHFEASTYQGPMQSLSETIEELWDCLNQGWAEGVKPRSFLSHFKNWGALFPCHVLWWLLDFNLSRKWGI